MLLLSLITSFAKVRLIDQKSDAAAKLIEFINESENKSRLKISKVRTDKRTEFCNQMLEEYFKRKGITHELTVPYNSQQNCKAERYNRTLMEKTRALLKTSGYAKNFSGEALPTANFSIKILAQKRRQHSF